MNENGFIVIDQTCNVKELIKMIMSHVQIIINT
jgi:hypothetical protein